MTSVLKRSRMALVAIAAALSVFVFTSGTAYAAQPGEENTWHAEGVTSHGDMTDARNQHGDHVQVWRGLDDNLIHIRVNSGPQYVLPDAQTDATPQVVTTGTQLFTVFHTGTNGYVFEMPIWVDLDSQEPLIISGWNQIPQGVRTTADRSVSVAVLGGADLYMAYRSATDNQLYGVYYNSVNGGWWAPAPITGATSTSSPSVAFSAPAQAIVVVYRGATTNLVYLTRQTYGDPAGAWTRSVTVGQATTDAQPAVAFASDGAGQVAIRALRDHRIQLVPVNERGATGAWTDAVGDIIAAYGPFLVALGTALYIHATNDAYFDVFYKRTRR
ncbi:hypothetical protein V2S66_14475 [Streptomyces sp. V4-01]|uniref:Uncharacterized protein n=1 Tax=Actinacidiphila polyblastidii TaxID=3110430 RepID=A0ABU7PBH6_9ACTN|nr:hypothetical protein [Streptomyces sp. V4-01]